MPPPKLALRFPRLLPILYKLYQHSISGCSKAPRGLSCPRVTCIFTGTIISPSLSLRQSPDRCAFRAGRNLPTRNFATLGPVIVTAAVYWGFNSHPSLTLSAPLNLPAPGRRQPLYFALRLRRACVFPKQSPGPIHCGSLGLAP